MFTLNDDAFQDAYQPGPGPLPLGNVEVRMNVVHSGTDGVDGFNLDITHVCDVDEPSWIVGEEVKRAALELSAAYVDKMGGKS